MATSSSTVYNASAASASVSGPAQIDLMTGWTKVFTDGYHEMMELEPDSRVKDWILMSSVWPTVGMSMAYVIMVKGVGPWLMKGRPACDLRSLLIFYNGLQVVFSAWLFSMGFTQSRWLGSYSLTCQPVDYSLSEHAIQTAAGCWWYYLSKFIEFFDTFFFVLRKKDRHITFLHAFHHGMMPIASWIVVKYVPGGHSTFGGMLNALVHIVMYLYYMIAAMGPSYQKFIWWKKYLTTLQMCQFTLIAAHSAQLFFSSKSCSYPKIFALFFFTNSIIFLTLFTNFYGKSYKNNNKPKIS